MDKHAENLKAHITAMFGMPVSIKDAFHAWVDSVEERLESMTKGTISIESTVGHGAPRADIVVQPAKSAEQAKPGDKK